MRETSVALASRALGIEPRAPSRLGDDALAEELRSLDLEFGVVASFGALIPETLLAIPRRGFWNVHPSLLPRWRGAAPVQRAILAGDRLTGVSIMKVVAALDAGPIAAMERTAIGERETAGALETRLAKQGAGTAGSNAAEHRRYHPPRTGPGRRHLCRKDLAGRRTDRLAAGSRGRPSAHPGTEPPACRVEPARRRACPYSGRGGERRRRGAGRCSG